MATELTNQTFDQSINNSDVPALVDFWAPWCAPCRALGPILEQLSEKLDGKAKIYKVNVDENPELAERYGIRSIPTVMAFKSGKLDQTLVGVQNEKRYEDALLN